MRSRSKSQALTPAVVLRAPGTNCEMETAWALGLAGMPAEIVPLARVLGRPDLVANARLVVIPGGFSFRDEGGPGRWFGKVLAGPRLGPALRALVGRGGGLLGICNGFQALVSAGWFGDGLRFAPNASGRFDCRWVKVAGRVKGALPIAHGEGRLVASPDTVARLEREGRIILKYVDNPDGSVGDIAGLRDVTGRVIGIMPHPERAVTLDQVPAPASREPAGLRLLRAIISGIR